MKLFELPKGWVLTKLEECAEIILGQSPPSSTYNENGEGLPFYQGKLEFGDIFPTPHKWCTAPKKIAEKGDVLISVRAPVGPTNICIEKSCIGRGLAAIRGLNDMESSFILYLLRAFEDDIAGKGTGTTFNAITGNQLKDFAVPFPPLPEQHRIVSKIEELFTKLDAGVKSLEKTKAQLKRYRQAVLKYAFEGKLTEEWRETHREIVEPASELLRNTLEEKAKQTKKKTKSFPQMGGSELRPLLDEWLSLTLDYLASSEKNSIKRGPFGSSIKKEFFVPSGYKVYEQKNVIYNDFERGDYFVDEKKFEELKDFEVKSGDVLMSCSGTVGKIAIAPEEIQPGIINQALLKISLDNDIVSTRYFVYLFRSKINEIILKNTRGSAMVNISSVKDLKQIPFPIPPKIEQKKIVEEIELRFSVADDVEKTVDQSLKQAERLRQSILKKAFEGKLVPNDPNDEPASVLLERIKAEKENRKKEVKSKLTKTKRKRDLVQKQRRFNDYV